MVIKSNIPALRTHVQVNRANRNTAASMARLSHGTRINTAKDDPAGLSIANRFRREVRGIDNATQNALDGTSLVQTADGALNEVHSILGRVRELIVQGANDTFLNSDRDAIQSEIDELLNELENIARNTRFNGRNIFTGSFVQAGTSTNPPLQHGNISVRVHTRKNDLMEMEIPRLAMFGEDALGGSISQNIYHDPSVVPPVLNPVTGEYELVVRIPAGQHVTLGEALHSLHGGSVVGVNVPGENHENSGVWLSNALEILDSATEQVSAIRSRMGAYQNRLEQSSSALLAASGNTQSALSRIIDTDMALEMARFTQQNVIVQAGISVLGMANQRPQQFLALLNH
ncbi:MAG: flagellin [Defluviitaleaceae bacterium]|nr:flagellin [Defluviitaleaceae bacterium]